MDKLQKTIDVPGVANDFYAEHLNLLNNSFFKCTGKYLLDGVKEVNIKIAKQIYAAPFVLISHGTQVDPIFNYGNRTALKLFAMQWHEFVKMPSRYSAEQPNREERARLLTEVQNKGFIDHYSGVRIAKNGHRFMIHNAIVWNVQDNNKLLGQAACFRDWQDL